MSAAASFEPVTEVVADEVRGSLLRGLADAAQGRVDRRDDLLETDG